MKPCSLVCLDLTSNISRIDPTPCGSRPRPCWPLTRPADHGRGGEYQTLWSSPAAPLPVQPSSTARPSSSPTAGSTISASCIYATLCLPASRCKENVHNTNNVLVNKCVLPHYHVKLSRYAKMLTRCPKILRPKLSKIRDILRWEWRNNDGWR